MEKVGNPILQPDVHPVEQHHEGTLIKREGLSNNMTLASMKLGNKAADEAKKTTEAIGETFEGLRKNQEDFQKMLKQLSERLTLVESEHKNSEKAFEIKNNALKEEVKQLRDENKRINEERANDKQVINQLSEKLNKLTTGVASKGVDLSNLASKVNEMAPKVKILDTIRQENETWKHLRDREAQEKSEALNRRINDLERFKGNQESNNRKFVTNVTGDWQAHIRVERNLW